MDYRIIWTPRSLETLEDALTRIAVDNPTAARHLGERIFNQVSILAQFPRLGHVFHELQRDDVRETLVKPYRVIYRVHDDRHAVSILTLWHTSRREPMILPDDSGSSISP
ncbi:MAG: type II toxin-antitoxin system RelE/ParE family toxin [Verrucomicrobia bacterium]|nr:type II toxin-antitoxin system RelE/ParE family toxin [Verrucomicrobiota bacterium]